MTDFYCPTRRVLLGAGLGMIAARAVGATLAIPTAAQELGPFYPVVRSLDQDYDLTRVKGAGGVAKGQIIDVFGKVTDTSGRPVPRAKLDLWQANAAGRYMHPGDTHDAPLDRNFQGSAVILADAQGHYRFRTIMPGTYPIGGGKVRTRHIHVDVTGRRERLTTQMYFTGEPLNDSDILFPLADPKQSVLARAVGPVDKDPGALGWHWDIVMAVG